MKLEEYRYLFDDRPCDAAVEWLETQPDLQSAWNNCAHGDWMWWALQYGRNTLPPKSLSVKFAKWCIDRIKHHDFNGKDILKDQVISVVESYAHDIFHVFTTADIAAAGAGIIANANARSRIFCAEELKLQADWIRDHVNFPF